MSADLAGEAVRVQVADNGIGTEPEHHEQHHKRIFGTFERIVPHTHGTGIGLAIVRRAGQRMGGRIGVESVPDEGATFWLELSRAGDPPAAAGSVPRPPAAGEFAFVRT